jgi:ferredoxin
MANINDRLAQNIPGLYYVDSSCIDCDMCRTTAPGFFKRDDSAGTSVVYRQPLTLEEFAQAEEGLRSCPTDSIGNNGDKPPNR